jgi:hypothetical protein
MAISIAIDDLEGGIKFNNEELLYIYLQTRYRNIYEYRLYYDGCKTIIIKNTENIEYFIIELKEIKKEDNSIIYSIILNQKCRTNDDALAKIDEKREYILNSVYHNQYNEISIENKEMMDYIDVELRLKEIRLEEETLKKMEETEFDESEFEIQEIIKREYIYKFYQHLVYKYKSYKTGFELLYNGLDTIKIYNTVDNVLVGYELKIEKFINNDILLFELDIYYHNKIKDKMQMQFKNNELLGTLEDISNDTYYKKLFEYLLFSTHFFG